MSTIKKTFHTITSKDIGKLFSVPSSVTGYEYMHTIATDYAKYTSENIQTIDHSNYTFDYITVTTVKNRNHPFMVVKLESKFVLLIYPLDVNVVQSIDVSKFSQEECDVMFVFIHKNIYKRQDRLYSDQKYGLLRCDNIRNCHKKIEELKMAKRGKSAKLARSIDMEIDEKKKWYTKKAVKKLDKYFEMLDNGDYREAFLFLRGKKGKYKGKERLDTTFYEIGHLHIFISLYEIYNKLICC